MGVHEHRSGSDLQEKENMVNLELVAAESANGIFMSCKRKGNYFYFFTKSQRLPEMSRNR